MDIKKYPGADLNRNRMIFFQIGLIVVLAFTYMAIEWKFTEPGEYNSIELQFDAEKMEDIPVTEIKNLPPPPPPPAIPEVIEVVQNDLEIEETLIESTESNQDEKIENVVQVAEIIEEKIEDAIEDVPFVLIANVPVYPGCESRPDNDSKKKCMSEKIEALVQKEFNTSLGAELGLFGINRIFVVFRINEKGDVVDIKSRGPHKILESEAERVVKLIPKMTPGKQRNRAVGVIYSLPITFEVREHS